MVKEKAKLCSTMQMVKLKSEYMQGVNEWIKND